MAESTKNLILSVATMVALGVCSFCLGVLFGLGTRLPDWPIFQW